MDSSRALFLSCPHCKTRGQLPADLQGVPALECPGCGRKIRVSSDYSQRRPKFEKSDQPQPIEDKPAIQYKQDSGGESWLSDFFDSLTGRDSLRVLSGLGVLATLAIALWLSGFFSDRGTEPESLERLTNVQIPTNMDEEPVIAKSVGNKLIRGAYIVFQRFVSAASSDEKLRWVLRSAEIEPQLREFYLKNPEPEPFSVSEFSPPAKVSTVDLQRGIAVLLKRSSDSRVDMIAFFRQTEDGIKLDWESYIQARTKRLSHFLRSSSAPSEVFRVRLTRSHYFGTGRQPAKTLCIQMDGLVPLEEPPYVFVPDDSPLAMRIEAELPWSASLKEGSRYATVKLGWEQAINNGTASGQLKLEELLCWELLGVGSEF